MTINIPTLGSVISFSYLWWDERRKGYVEGRKDRPSCVIVSKLGDDGGTTFFVLPITHTRPKNDEDGVEIPPITKRRLGLDDLPSWIITTEYNKFDWPGYDIRILRNGDYSYGVLPTALLEKVRLSFRRHIVDKTLNSVNRND